MEFTKVSDEQINEMVQKGTLKEMTVVKDVPVKAVELTEKVVEEVLAQGGYKTVAIDKDGNLFPETTNKKINVGDFLVTNQIEGYENSYVVPAAKFANLYTPTENKEIFNPVATDKKVYLIPEGTNLEFEAKWGPMFIRGGGVVVPDDEKFYGINPEELKATHSVKAPAVQNNVEAVLEKVRGTTVENTTKPKLG